jgi:hypothetical protein
MRKLHNASFYIFFIRGKLCASMYQCLYLALSLYVKSSDIPFLMSTSHDELVLCRCPLKVPTPAPVAEKKEEAEVWVISGTRNAHLPPRTSRDRSCASLFLLFSHTRYTALKSFPTWKLMLAFDATIIKYLTRLYWAGGGNLVLWGTSLTLYCFLVPATLL